jgi:hypothetical protein
MDTAQTLPCNDCRPSPAQAGFCLVSPHRGLTARPKTGYKRAFTGHQPPMETAQTRPHSVFAALYLKRVMVTPAVDRIVACAGLGHAQATLQRLSAESCASQSHCYSRRRPKRGRVLRKPALRESLLLPPLTESRPSPAQAKMCAMFRFRRGEPPLRATLT